MNTTSIIVNYADAQNKTATITAEYTNDSIENVQLHRTDDDAHNPYVIMALIAVLMCIAGYIIYRKLMKEEEQIEEEADSTKVAEPFDHRAAALELLDEAKKLFAHGEHKDAYGRAGQALRTFMSYEYDLRKEVTNDEIITFLRTHDKQHQDAKKCFDLCSLVEFAKYEANKKDFSAIISYAAKIID